ncbi:hypothetical protein CWI38_0107p0010 [Hamiltosporidium tvaerminnensis]|uniref:Integrase catalytic domain-containing protein n=1 Tax=Hamiltosporidium tvaerminnensis TaxID=1176355 RepID=A0A4Q9M3Y2_9MICR|nr:hypothetical protein CWI38_0107p0010 [Hamiltosporidium tvaerminnensis]
MNSRCKDLIDMHSQSDDLYKFIHVYQDHLNKFIQLQPLNNKSAEEDAYVFLDIFTIFGAPSILKGDNGRESENNTIKSYMTQENPKHSQRSKQHACSSLKTQTAGNDRRVYTLLRLYKIENIILKVGLGSFLTKNVLLNINCEVDLEILLKYQENLKSVNEGILQIKLADITTGQHNN